MIIKVKDMLFSTLTEKLLPKRIVNLLKGKIGSELYILDKIIIFD